MTDTVYEAPSVFTPPARFRQYESSSDDELVTYLLTVVDFTGRVHVVDDLGTRGAALELRGEWEAATTGCGTSCFLTWYLDPASGRVSDPIFAPLYEDPEAGIVVISHEQGALLFYPFEPERAWYVELPGEGLRSAMMNAAVDIEVVGDQMEFRTGDSDTVFSVALPNLE